MIPFAKSTGIVKCINLHGVAGEPGGGWQG